MRRLIVILAGALTLAFGPAAAARPRPLHPATVSQRAAAMEAAFTRWAQAYDVRQGAIAIRFRGQAAGGTGFGGRGIDDAAPVASLSKAITALCAARLIDAGRLDYETTVGEALAGFAARAGEPRDPRLAGVTLGQILSHRSGIPRSLPFTTRRTEWRPGMQSALEEQVRRVFAAPLEFEPGARYEYSNQGYVLLSYVIETAAGEDYESHCRRTVLEPARVTTARLNPMFPDTPRAGAGGWTISVSDYARFADQLRPERAGHGPRTRAWLTERENDEPFYGLGYQYRGPPGRRVLAHNGLLNEPDLSVSALFALWPSGLTIALNATPARPRVLDELMAELAAIATGRTE
ncbi:serine hydrolase domain-containing protein [Brevundimonas sp.]|uniref:serine hydrolase domain-containing protein n=1 Tax=Brevundimonas sp. TaxID=1871086 RepID=UPI002D5F7C82|nr:serine hydrolase domain-containing protein [Brevundimonas sp.]HYC66976.1 serine hydrolase domain-containing protein [Brevundimonas sp.]